jgi:Ni/Co efflux regulator RcnB
MKYVLSTALAVVLFSTAAPIAFAQPHDDRHDDHGQMHGGPGGAPHHDWHPGGRIEPSDWNRGQRVDYRAHHLRRPGRGQEWRDVDGNYVLAAVAGGAIASLIAH